MDSMKKVYLISMLMGSLEVALVTLLTYQTYTQAGWWGLALLAYFIYCFIIGANLKTVLTLAMTSVFLMIAYIQYGILGAIVTYVLIVFVAEFLPILRKKRDLTDQQP